MHRDVQRIQRYGIHRDRIEPDINFGKTLNIHAVAGGDSGQVYRRYQIEVNGEIAGKAQGEPFAVDIRMGVKSTLSVPNQRVKANFLQPKLQNLPNQ